MIAKSVKLLALALVVLLSTACSDFVRPGRSPVLLVVKSLQGASGADPSKFGGVLWSDVITMRTTPDPCTTSTPCPTVWADNGQVAMGLQLKDQGSLTVVADPSLTNRVTIDRYRVEYQRTDGQNRQGIDVPFSFDSAVTFTVPTDQDVTANFELVRHAAKEEAPLAALASSGNIISTIATVTFYGHDQAGNQIIATGRIGINFGDFADPN